MTRPHLLVPLAVATLLAAPYARAGDPSVPECLTATENAVKLKKELKLRKAREQLILCGAPSCPSMVRADCTHGVDEVNGLLPTIVFTVKTAAGQELSAVKVTMDGEVVAEHLDGGPLTLDPGSHEFTFAAVGQPPVTQTLMLHANEKGRSETVLVGPPAPTPTPPLPTAPALVSPAPPPSTLASQPSPPPTPIPVHEPINTGSGQRIAGWVLGGVGLAAAGVGVVMAMEGQSQHNDAVSTQLAGNTALAQSEESSANTTKTIGYATLGAGGALLVGGIVLLITAPSSRAATTSHISFHPLISKSEAGGGLSLDW